MLATIMSERVRIGIVGDLHGHWDEWDARYFAEVGYDLVLFTGDLGSGTRNDGVRIARSIGRLNARALVLPGNNDASAAPQILAELGHQRGLASLLRLGGDAGMTPRGEVHVSGYDLRRFTLGGRRLGVLGARPYSRGGGELSSPELLAASHGITDMDDSARRLCALVDEAAGDDLIMLAHNGPTGLGGAATDPWGRDFAPEAGDWGDPDLAAALAHARARGTRVLAVVAGHMHTRTRDGRARTWQVTREGTLFVNAARVPRIVEEASGRYRHHVLLELTDDVVSARELLVREPD